MPSAERVTPVAAFSAGDLDPLHWLGSAASAAVGDVWKAAMIALWSAGMWVLGLAFKLIDAFTTPDLSTSGPLALILPYTFGIGAAVAVLLGLVQVGVAAIRRDGQSLGRVLIGIVQFGAVWIAYLTVAATVVTATAGLTRGLLDALLHVESFGDITASQGWPTNVNDTVVATVLGLCTVFVIFPASIGYVLIMVVREAALLILACTSPIAAAGLLSETTRSWFWRSLRWFIATVLIAPLAALVLGIGVQITRGTLATDAIVSTAARVGMAVTGCILMLIGAICPVLLFRLLAFVEPGTSSGAVMRQAWAANGGVAGVLAGRGSSHAHGSGADTAQGPGGVTQGEAAAAQMTATRFAGVGGVGGVGAAVLAKTVHGLGAAGANAAQIGSDVLSSAGVGHPAPYVGAGLGARTPGGGDGSSSTSSSGSVSTAPGGEDYGAAERGGAEMWTSDASPRDAQVASPFEPLVESSAAASSQSRAGPASRDRAGAGDGG